MPLTLAAEKDACLDCHKDPTLRIKNRRLYDYYNEWTQSSHKLAGVSCSDCHGGDPTVPSIDKETAHAGVFLPTDSQSSVYYKNLPATCGQCHEKVFDHFITSRHFRKLQKEAEAPHCATCHGSMNSRIYYTSIVDSTCQTCHKEEDLADVASQARNILQHLKIAQAYLGWTTLYYESKGQPERMKDLNERYQRIADAWHRFDLDASQKDSVDFLHDLDGIFQTAWAEKNPGKPLP